MRRLLVLLGMGITIGCGNGNSFDGADDAGQVRQASRLTALPPRGVPGVALIAVDDAATTAGRVFRAAVAADFREQYDASRVRATESCEPPRDPASLTPMRRYAIVLAPSAEGDLGIHSFVDDPSLAWLADERRDDDAASWSEAVAQAIKASETADAFNYQPMALLERWVQLLSHEATPQSERERAIVDALPASIDLELFLASTRDDDMPSPASDYRLEPSENCAHGGACVGELRRFEAETDLFDVGYVQDCRPRCGKSPAVSETTLAVECRVLVASYQGEDCASIPGWVEPSISSAELDAALEDYPGYRYCEIQQLAGKALEACVNDLDCKDCTPGFCATRVPELLENCAGQAGQPWPLRFPRFPDHGGTLILDAQCNLAQ
jgi:hypothetical protein